MKTYRTQEIAKNCKVSVSQLQYWDWTDLIKPSVKQAGGKGSVRIYSEEDAEAIKAIKELREKGVSLQKVRNVIIDIIEKNPDSYVLSEYNLKTNGRNIFVLEDNTLIDFTSKKQLELPFIK